MSKSIITQREIIQYSEVSKFLGTCKFDNVSNIEWNEYYDRIGLEFYELLKSSLLTENSYPEWSMNDNYSVGNVVTLADKFYIAKNDNINSIVTSDDWNQLVKFNSECLDSLWCNGLATYIANSIVVQRLPLLASRVTEKGIVKFTDETFYNASDKSIKNIEIAFHEARDRSWKRLKYIVDNDETECYDLFKGKTNTMGCGCTVSCGCGSSSNRRKGWIVEDSSSSSCNPTFDQSFVPALSALTVVQPIAKSIQPYETLEEGYASGDKAFYLNDCNEEGAVENTLIFNPNGTIDVKF